MPGHASPFPSRITEEAGRIARSIPDGIDATVMIAVEMLLGFVAMEGLAVG